MPKESILISAESYMNTFKDWPDLFKRQSKEQLEQSFIPDKTVKYQPTQIGGLKKPKVGEFIKKEDEFELRTMKRPFIEFKPHPTIPSDNILAILMTVRKIVEEDYEIQSIGKAFEIARDNIKKNVLHLNYLWDMSKYSNIFQRTEKNVGLSAKEKKELLEEIDYWIKLSEKNV